MVWTLALGALMAWLALASIARAGSWRSVLMWTLGLGVGAAAGAIQAALSSSPVGAGTGVDLAVGFGAAAVLVAFGGSLVMLGRKRS